MSYEGITIFPDGGIFEIPETTQLHFIVSLEHDTQTASLTFGAQELALSKNKSSGLWETDFSIDTQSTSTISILAGDSLGNRTTPAVLGEIKMVSRGRTVAGAKITVFVRKADQSLVVWQAAGAYHTKNPIFSDEEGEYALLLPAGEYQIVVEKPGYQRLRISDFEILTPRFVSLDLPLTPRVGLRGFLEDVLERLSF